MKAWRRLTDPTEDIMGPAIVWYAHPIIQASVGSVAGGLLTTPFTNSNDIIQVGAGIGLVGAPVLYWKGRNIYEYVATSPACQRVIQSVQRIF